MDVNPIIVYLIVINIVTFIAFVIDRHLYDEGSRFFIHIVILLALIIFGGALGGTLAIYIFDRHITKDNLVWHLLAPIVLIAEIGVFLLWHFH